MSIYDKASLVLIPSGTKTSKVYSQKPTNGDGDFTFSRSTAATRVNASGNIEKETNNYLLQSNTFDTTWANYNSTETGGQSGYDGSSDAWEMNKTGASGLLSQTISTTGVQTFSVYAKAGTLDFVMLRYRTTSTQYHGTYFDLANGSVETETSQIIDSTITSIGSGWYRCSISFSQTLNQIYIYASDVDGGIGNSNTGTIYIQDAQLEQGLVARDYIETTTTAIYGGITDNVPRLDYTDSSCPALLLEPQRTNHYYQSEYFSTGTRVVIANNSTTSPENVNNATSVIATSVNGSHEVTLSPLISIANTNPRTFSIYAKYNGNHLILNVAGSSSSWTACIFDLQNGVAKTPQNAGSQSACTADIEEAGNGWYRCSITYTPYASGGFYHLISLTDDVNATLVAYGADEYVGDDVSGIYIYGAQMEEASYATSYIPTYGSAVTRNSDTTYKYNATSIVGDTEGVMFIDCVPPANDNPILMQLINNTSVYSQSIYFEYVKSINKIRCNAYDSGILQASFQLDAVIGNQYKIALAYKENDFAFYVNGSLIGTDTNASVQSGLQDILIGVLKGSFGSYNFIGNYVNQAMLFKTRLSNEELATLTTI